MTEAINEKLTDSLSPFAELSQGTELERSTGLGHHPRRPVRPDPRVGGTLAKEDSYEDAESSLSSSTSTTIAVVPDNGNGKTYESYSQLIHAHFEKQNKP